MALGKYVQKGALALTLAAMTVFLQGCGEGNANALPEFNGVYVRYDDGTLVKIDGLPVSTTAWVDLKKGEGVHFSTLAKARNHMRYYVTQEPKVEVDIARVRAFIVKGGEAKQPGFPKWLITHYVSTANISGKPFENKGSGTKENMYISTVACGTADGMHYKEETPGTFVFIYPVDEKSDYKFCDLRKNKTTWKADSIWDPKADAVSFYGIWHDGMMHAFAVK